MLARVTTSALLLLALVTGPMSVAAARQAPSDAYDSQTSYEIDGHSFFAVSVRDLEATAA